MITHYEDANIKIYKVKCPPFDNNAYLLVCPKTNESIIIDTPDNISDLIKIASNTEVKAILITHNHSDHIQGLTDITSAIPSQVGIAKADSDALLRNPDLLLKDGDITKAGTINLRTIASPGHTAGSSCFVVGKHLFSGDTLFPGGPGRSESPRSLAQIIDSITTKLLVLSDDVVFYPGHGEDGDIKTAKKEYSIFESADHSKNLYGDVLWLKD